jgi:putative phosphoribosyl transferase
MHEFKDRNEAGKKLSEALQVWRGQNPLVLGIPRGAVPMARVIADRLGGELDIVLVHKVGAPRHPEFAVASVTEDGDVFLSSGARELRLSQTDIEADAIREIKELQRRRKMFTPKRGPIDPKGRVCIVVDDGIATGATMVAALRWLSSKLPARLIVATPAASSEAVDRIAREGAEVVALKVSDMFYAVSMYYQNFNQIGDDEVLVALSGKSEKQGEPRATTTRHPE